MTDNLTDRVRWALADAASIAAAWGHKYVGSEHLLLALSRCNGVSQNALDSLGVTPEALETMTKQLLGITANMPERVRS